MNTWNIIIEGFNKADITKHESIFSLGNGAMGMRANFEEDYTGDTLQGSYIGGVYYPDKTRVGWWKNGYPEYFAKVLNAPSWIGLHIKINGELLDYSPNYPLSPIPYILPPKKLLPLTSYLKNPLKNYLRKGL